jgi:hypothetical protein
VYHMDTRQGESLRWMNGFHRTPRKTRTTDNKKAA